MTLPIVLLVLGGMIALSASEKPKGARTFKFVMTMIARALIGGVLLIIGFTGVIAERGKSSEEVQAVQEKGPEEDTVLTTSPEPEEPAEPDYTQGEAFQLIQAMLNGEHEPSSRSSVTADGTYREHYDDVAETFEALQIVVHRVESTPAAWFVQVSSSDLSPREIFAFEQSRELPVHPLLRVYGPLGLALLHSSKMPLFENGYFELKSPEYVQAIEPDLYWLLAEDEPTSLPNSRLFRACEQLIKDNLLAPSQAKFPGFFEMLEPRVTYENDGSKTWHAWVESQNAFGAQIRRTFQCRYNRPNDTVAVEFT